MTVQERWEDLHSRKQSFLPATRLQQAIIAYRDDTLQKWIAVTNDIDKAAECVECPESSIACVATHVVAWNDSNTFSVFFQLSEG